MGILEVHDDRLQFLGQLTTEQISYADIIGVSRGAAVNQWGAALPEFARLIIHRSGRGPVALSCTHSLADVIEQICRDLRDRPVAAARPSGSNLLDRTPGTAEVVAVGGTPVFRGTLIACFDDEAEGAPPLGCASAFGFSSEGVSLTFGADPAIFLPWAEVTTVGYSGARYSCAVGGGDEPEYKRLLEAGIPRGRARVLIGDHNNEWLLDASWVPQHKELLDDIDCVWGVHSDLEPWFLW